MTIKSITFFLKRIELSRIQTEAYFGEKPIDFHLKDVLEDDKSGFLQVEGPCEDEKYILVEGYRQFFNLQLLNEKDVLCKVTPLTSTTERILKRLINEQLHKPKTTDEKEAMIAPLLPYYTAEEISALTHMPIPVVKKHEKMLGINPALRQKRKASGAGKTGLPVILDLPYINSSFKLELLDSYFRRDIKPPQGWQSKGGL
jgi:hypothetical protein